MKGIFRPVNWLGSILPLIPFENSLTVNIMSDTDRAEIEYNLAFF